MNILESEIEDIIYSNIVTHIVKIGIDRHILKTKKTIFNHGKRSGSTFLY